MNQKRKQAVVNLLKKLVESGITVFPWIEDDGPKLIGADIPDRLRAKAKQLKNDILEFTGGLVVGPYTGPGAHPDATSLTVKSPDGLFMTGLVDCMEEAWMHVERLFPGTNYKVDCKFPDGRHGWLLLHGAGAYRRWRSGLTSCPCCGEIYVTKTGEYIKATEEELAMAYHPVKDTLAAYAEP